MLNRFNKFQAALALALYSQSVLGQYYPNSTTIPSNSSSSSFSSTSSSSFSISSSITQSTSSTPDVSSSLTQLTSSSDVSSSIASSSSPGSGVSSSVTQSSSSGSSPSGTGSTATTPSGTTPSGTGSTATTPSGTTPSGTGSTATTPSGTTPSGTGSTATTPSGTGSTATTPSGTGSTTTSPSGSGPSESGSSASITQSVSSAPSLSSSIPQSTSSGSTVSGSVTGSLSSITSSASSASATASNSLSSSDGTIYLPSTTISGDLTLTGSVIATEAVEIAAGGKLTLLDGDKYVFSADLIVHGDLSVEKSKPTYPGTEFDITGENFDVSGTFNAEEPAASSASTYSFTPGSFINSGGISLSLSASPKGEVTFSPYSNSGTFTLSNSNINGGSVSGLQRRAESAGSVNNGEINLDNGSTYVIVEPVSGSGTINIISGNLYLHHPDTFTGQTVVFKGEGVLAVDPTESNSTPIPVIGYTGKNQIAITADVTSLSYESTTGVLTATQGNSQFSFAIGTGYSSSGFNVSEGTFAGANAYYLNYGGAIASSATSSSTPATSGLFSSTSVTGSTLVTSSRTAISGSATSVSGSSFKGFVWYFRYNRIELSYCPSHDHFVSHLRLHYNINVRICYKYSSSVLFRNNR
ncbi:Hpf1p [Saccharomyces cerevisiae Lalvin QA23]|nr:Hpf1p [Saccharomyces cerevisiae Lalvin QA23]